MNQEGRLANAQVALDLAISQYFDACIALHAPPTTASNKNDYSHMSKITEKCEIFIQSATQRLSNIALVMRNERNQQAHINRIPAELLVKIFQCYLDAHKSSIESDTPGQTHVSQIILLSSVCSRWRKFVVETSSFWSFIPIHFSKALVTLCTERAQNRPLHIMAVEGGDGTVPDVNELRENWSILEGLSRSIYSMTLVTATPAWIFSPINWALRSNNLWDLHELSVAFTGGYWQGRIAPSSADSTINFDNPLVNQVHTLSLKRMHAKWAECTFDRLSILKLDSLEMRDVDEFKHIIAAIPTLQVLELRYLGFRGSMFKESTSEPLTLPNLKTLRLSYIKNLAHIVDAFNPAEYNVELDVDTLDVKARLKSSNTIVPIWVLLSDLEETFSKMKNITLLGIGREPDLLQWGPLCPVIDLLPSLTALHIEDTELCPAQLLTIQKVVREFPRIKTIRMRRVIINDIEIFKNVVDSCSAERIELVDCSVILDDAKVLIQPGTPSFEWALKSAHKISFLQE
ncbi:unnamed protein product [Rhizoctonia solani]|uniref:F-box domain-containing protein n=1 Tax=Rhizoctonia solani TaxID=456999 RepID=A0A8H3DZ77_9AGAM|nr:unnamed protein product [Rhizoctonia solani]